MRHKTFRRKKNSLRGINSLNNGAQKVLRDVQNGFQSSSNSNNEILDSYCDALAKQTIRNAKCLCMQSVMRAVSGIENMSIDCHATIIADVCVTHTPQSIKNNRHSRPNSRVFTHRVRDREPSRIQSICCIFVQLFNVRFESATSKKLHVMLLY